MRDSRWILLRKKKCKLRFALRKKQIAHILHFYKGESSLTFTIIESRLSKFSYTEVLIEVINCIT